MSIYKEGRGLSALPFRGQVISGCVRLATIPTTLRTSTIMAISTTTIILLIPMARRVPINPAAGMQQAGCARDAMRRSVWPELGLRSLHPSLPKGGVNIACVCLGTPEGNESRLSWAWVFRTLSLFAPAAVRDDESTTNRPALRLKRLGRGRAATSLRLLSGSRG